MWVVALNSIDGPVMVSIFIQLQSRRHTYHQVSASNVITDNIPFSRTSLGVKNSFLAEVDLLRVLVPVSTLRCWPGCCSAWSRSCAVLMCTEREPVNFRSWEMVLASSVLTVSVKKSYRFLSWKSVPVATITPLTRAPSSKSRLGSTSRQ